MKLKPEEHSIQLSIGSIALLIYGSIAMIALGFLMWSTAETQTKSSPEFARLMSILTITFSGLCGLYGVRRCFDARGGLIINKSGIIDNSSAFSIGLIEWVDIQGFGMVQFRGIKMLLVFVSNPQKYLNSASILNRISMRWNTRKHGTPFCISTGMLTCSYTELKSLVEQGYAMNKIQQNASLNLDQLRRSS